MHLIASRPEANAEIGSEGRAMRLECRADASMATLFLLCAWAAAANSQMLPPSIDDPGEPFSYFSRPTGEIGVMGAEAATEITPEGYLRTGFGELMFFEGAELTPTSVRINTLEQGRLPIVHYAFVDAGIRYRFTMFAAPLGTDSTVPVNFVRIAIENGTARPARAVIAAGVRYDAARSVSARHGDNRFDRPASGAFAGDYRQLGEDFSADWVYGFGPNRFLRAGEALYFFAPGAQLSLTPREFYNYPPEQGPRKLSILPDTPVGIARYSLLLAPGEQRTLDFKMPVVPPSDPSVIAAIDRSDFDEALGRVRATWTQLLDAGMRIALPEAKPVEVFDASLVYDLIAIDRIGPDTIQTVNKLHYHSFYLRDTADIVHMYDVTGHADVARAVLDFYAKSQRADGNFLSQEQQYDGWGEALWAYGQHYRFTRDASFAEQVLPKIDRAVDWLVAARARDPLHIMPASDVQDNEMIPGHLTGYNFLALSGLRVCIEMAEATLHRDLAAKWRAEYTRYRSRFLSVLDRATRTTGGYIPPALDGRSGGYDWGNLLAVVPEPTLDPGDPRVTATLRATRAKYQEGIMTYADGRYLHHYLTIKNTLTEVVRGDQRDALGEFYALLLHTSAANAGFEFAIRPWGNRDFADNLAPHGWFAAEYRTLLRNMLVREQGARLHLLSVLSPEWLGAGKTVSVRNAPTAFGTFGFTLEQPSATEALLQLNAQFRTAPERIAVHLPWYMRLESARVDGKPVAAAHGVLLLPATAKQLRLLWARRDGTPDLSFANAVADYQAEYARRYDQLMHGAP
jgi:hypothetical protein